MALIDSGSKANFIDERWAREHDIPLTDLKDSTSVLALDGSVISKVLRSTRRVSPSQATIKRQFILLFFYPLLHPLF